MIPEETLIWNSGCCKCFLTKYKILSRSSVISIFFSFSMNILSRTPENITSRTKCLIMLHGVWSNELDLFALKEKLGNDLVTISLRAPFTLWKGRFAWYPVDFSSGNPVYATQDVEIGFREIVTCIDEVKSKYDISPENIFLLGFSQWAIMSYYILWRSPEKIGGIIGLSGRLLDEIEPDAVDPVDYAGKRVFIGHGVDDTVIPVTATGPTSLFARKLAIEPTVKFYPIGHSISSDEIADIRTWLG